MSCTATHRQPRGLRLRPGTLTVRAVLPRPAVLAAPVALAVAGVVAEGVVAGPAVGGASLAVVVLAADHVVRVAQLALVAEVDVLGPVLPHGQSAAGRQATDEVVLVLWWGARRSVIIRNNGSLHAAL